MSTSSRASRSTPRPHRPRRPCPHRASQTLAHRFHLESSTPFLSPSPSIFLTDTPVLSPSPSPAHTRSEFGAWLSVWTGRHWRLISDNASPRPRPRALLHACSCPRRKIFIFGPLLDVIELPIGNGETEYTRASPKFCLPLSGQAPPSSHRRDTPLFWLIPFRSFAQTVTFRLRTNSSQNSPSISLAEDSLLSPLLVGYAPRLRRKKPTLPFFSSLSLTKMVLNSCR